MCLRVVRWNKKLLVFARLHLDRLKAEMQIGRLVNTCISFLCGGSGLQLRKAGING